MKQRQFGNGVRGWWVLGQGGDSRTNLGLSFLWGHLPRGQMAIGATQIQDSLVGWYLVMCL